MSGWLDGEDEVGEGCGGEYPQTKMECSSATDGLLNGVEEIDKMSWVWNAVTVLMVDQRVGEMSSCRPRRAEEYRRRSACSCVHGPELPA
jgi:hypothetical protein